MAQKTLQLDPHASARNVVRLHPQFPESPSTIEANGLGQAVTSWWRVANAHDYMMAWEQVADWAHGAGSITGGELLAELVFLADIAAARRDMAQARGSKL